jgi:hypothetical protein
MRPQRKSWEATHELRFGNLKARPKNRWDDFIKMDLEETVREYVDWINLTWDTAHW